ncbi:MAG TPA: hypothetical protein VN541_15520 [Tepidisphaeraceae bacterium]|nr:hypothetical protein [Tepidisphaeraceae bacterium]
MCELPEFPLNGPQSRAGEPYDMANVIFLLRVTQKQVQDRTAGFPKQHIPELI